MKILLVEDDQPFARLLHKTLEQRQYRVDVAIDGQEGWELAETFPYDLILLDWMLPQLDGISFCKRLRSGRQPFTEPLNQETPVLLMTALDTVTNKIMGLDAGADDYLVKPFDIDELQARIRALERRGRTHKPSVLEWEGLCLQLKSCEVSYWGKPIALTFKEYQLLELLLRYPDHIFSQGRLIEHLWGADETPSDNAVRAQIKGLRQKLKQVGAQDIIETIYKLGYRLKKTMKEPESETIGKESFPHVALAQSEDISQVDCSIALDLWDIWQECRDSYFDRILVIEQAVAALHNGHLTSNLLHQAEREAHTLIGSLGSFGLEEASRLSRQIQQILKQDTPLKAVDAARLAPLLQALRQAMNPQQATESQDVSEYDAAMMASLPRLLIIDDDAILATRLATEATPWGLQATIATNLTQARQHLVQQQPHIVLLDLNLSESGESGLDFLRELTQSQPGLPVLVFTASNTLSDRIQAARSGCKGFLQKTTTPAQVLATVAQTLQQSQPQRGRLLIVDDDPQLLALLQCVLEPEGYDLTLLDNAQQFWDVLEQASPDLLILDVDLQNHSSLANTGLVELNGFDLCRIIRNDPQWGNLPILFLSACTEADRIQQGFEAGADDFLHKPIAPLELLTRVRKRLEQGKIRHQTEIDPLTGVCHRRKFLQDFTRLLKLAQRQQQLLSFVVLDLDHFKKINDQYGHEMGDRVLHHFGSLLSQSFRQEDIIGRWGGEEFVLGLYRMSKADGVKRLTEILKTLKRETFTSSDGRTFQVSFSGGIAQFSIDGTDLETLYRAADRALYQAKTQGRSQIVEASEQG